MDDKRAERLQKLYPKLQDDELERAAENLDAYLEIAWEIFEDMGRDLPKKKSDWRKPVDSIQQKFDSHQGVQESLVNEGE